MNRPKSERPRSKLTVARPPVVSKSEWEAAPTAMIAARISGAEPPPEAAKPLPEVVTLGPPLGGEERAPRA